VALKKAQKKLIKKSLAAKELGISPRQVRRPQQELREPLAMAASFARSWPSRMRGKRW